jgi:hypothetical protein
MLSAARKLAHLSHVFQKTPIRAFSSGIKDDDVVILSVARTPITKIGGSFASMTGALTECVVTTVSCIKKIAGPKLAAVAIKEAVKRAGTISCAWAGDVIYIFRCFCQVYRALRLRKRI